MRIAIAQINPWLGYFSYNAEKIIGYTHRAHEKRAQVVVFPEMSLFGYPPCDLLERKNLVKLQAKEIKKIITQIPKGILVIFGALKEDKPYQNTAVIVQKNKKPIYVAKQLLPTYDVFDEARFFNPGDKTFIGNFKGIGKLAITVCEDMWAEAQGHKYNPLAKIKKVDAVINISASPFSLLKNEKRIAVAKKHVKKIKAPFIYVNQVGAQDELIFDGRSFVLDEKAKMLVQATAFEEDLVIIDLENKKTEHRPQPSENSEILRQALVLGIRDFFKKTGQKKAHLGLSGGIDSAVTACLTVEALGPNQVVGILMPGPFSSKGSVTDAEQLAKNLKIKTATYEINDVYETLTNSKEKLTQNSANTNLAQQNLQARIRALTLMYFSNLENSMLLSTSNKSEIAAGYSTLYGDSCGGLAPIGDLTKRQVYELAEFYNKEREIIPKSSIEKAPSAELAPNQKDQDTLPPYDELDSAVKNIVENKSEPKNKIEFWLDQKINAYEFKRWQAPPILRVSEHSFGRGRRMPIAYKLESKSN